MPAEKTLWIKHPLASYSACGEDASAGVLAKGATIAEVLPAGQRPSVRPDQVFDAGAHVLLPGLVNSHHHFFQTLTRAYPAALNKELFDWLGNLYPLWAGLTPEMLHCATRVALAELLLSGCTTSADHHYLFPAGMGEAFDAQAEAAAEMGARVTLGRGSMSMGEDQGGLPPRSVVESEADILRDSVRVIDKFHDRREGAWLQVALAPCSPFSVSESLMRDTAALALDKGVRLHTHLAETHDEEAFCQDRFGCRSVDYLERAGWLNQHAWLAHGIHFDDAEITRLGAAGVGIAHCPGSNMMLASGICRNLELEAVGAAVGLAVDGSASNDASNMMLEVRLALYLQRLRYGAAAVSHLDALRWATAGSAALLGRGDIGSLAVGKQADLALFKLDDIAFAGSHDPLAALILCGAQRADRVMIGGEWRVKDRELINVDLGELIAGQNRQAMLLAKAQQ